MSFLSQGQFKSVQAVHMLMDEMGWIILEGAMQLYSGFRLYPIIRTSIDSVLCRLPVVMVSVIVYVPGFS